MTNEAFFSVVDLHSRERLPVESLSPFFDTLSRFYRELSSHPLFLQQRDSSEGKLAFTYSVR